MSDPNTVYVALDAIADSEHGTRQAVLFQDTASPTAGPKQSLSFRDLARHSLLAARFLVTRCGVKKGDAVLLYLPTSPEWLAFFFATARIGAIAIALNTRFKESELAHFVRTSGAKVAVLEQGFVGTDYLGIVAKARAEAGVDKMVVVDVGGSPVASSSPSLTIVKYAAPSPEDLAAADSLRRDPLLSQGTADALSATFTTSGTTGLPKLASHAQRTLVTHAKNTAQQWHVSPTGQFPSRLLLAVPLCGVFGLAQSMMVLLSGSTLVLVNLFQPQACAALVESEKVTHLLAPDNIVHTVLELHSKAPGSKTSYTFPSLRFIGYANFTSSLGNEILELSKLLPGLHLSGLYGSSELLALMSAWDPSADPIELRALGGGRLNPGIKVRVVDSDGSPIVGLGPDHKGELEFSGYSLLKEYLRNEAAMKKNLRDDGGVRWFRTGDLGYLVPALPGSGYSSSPSAANFAQGNATDSFIYLARMGDTLRLRGFLVDPTEIEAVVVKHRFVAEVQVVGVNLGGGKGEDAVAFVIPSDEFRKETASISSGAADKAMETAVLAHAKPLLANYKIPARVFVVDEFPATNGPNGLKVQKVVLRDMATKKMGAKL
ncbi:hypothetical protein DFJ74DRAFT_669491 [Hyaloraphidium curvatum]|nr:hypothetical protein DFJ74DRAFT_669491 [Hyaloraphidium curvatum]